jgi:hypothetical protein
MNRFRWISPVCGALALTVACAAPAAADIITIVQPNAAYLAATTLLPVAGDDFEVVPSLTGGGVTATFDVGPTLLTVPVSWSAWGAPPSTESATPRVLWTNGLTELSIAFSTPLSLFGLEAQPNTQVASPITAEFFFGSSALGTIDLLVNGNGGARLFAASSTDQFDRVVLSSTDDFAVAQLRVQAVAVPEPSILVNVITGAFGASVWALWMKRGRVDGDMKRGRDRMALSQR